MTCVALAVFILFVLWLQEDRFFPKYVVEALVCSSSDPKWHIGTPCHTGVGECLAYGKMVCDGDQATRCDAVPKAPTLEVCDGKDNNCNGLTDEDLPACVCTCSAGYFCQNDVCIPVK